MKLIVMTEEEWSRLKEELIQEVDKVLNAGKPKNMQILTASEVCRMLKVSKSKLQYMRANGTIPYCKIEGATAYVYEDIVEMIKRNKFNEKED